MGEDSALVSALVSAGGVPHIHGNEPLLGHDSKIFRLLWSYLIDANKYNAENNNVLLGKRKSIFESVHSLISLLHVS